MESAPQTTQNDEPLWYRQAMAKIARQKRMSAADFDRLEEQRIVANAERQYENYGRDDE